MPLYWTADQIYELRIACRQTQAEFAQELKVDRMTVARWEEGKSTPGVKNMIKLDALNVEMQRQAAGNS